MPTSFFDSLKVINTGYIFQLKDNGHSVQENFLVHLENCPGTLSKTSCLLIKLDSYDEKKIQVFELYKILHISMGSVKKETYVKLKVLLSDEKTLVKLIFRSSIYEDTVRWFNCLGGYAVFAKNLTANRTHKILKFPSKFMRNSKSEDSSGLSLEARIMVAIYTIEVEICTCSDFDLEEEGRKAHLEVCNHTLSLIIDNDVRENASWDLELISQFGSSGCIFLFEVIDEETKSLRIYSFYSVYARLLADLLKYYCQNLVKESTKHARSKLSVPPSVTRCKRDLRLRMSSQKKSFDDLPKINELNFKTGTSLTECPEAEPIEILQNQNVDIISGEPTKVAVASSFEDEEVGSEVHAVSADLIKVTTKESEASVQEKVRCADADEVFEESTRTGVVATQNVSSTKGLIEKEFHVSEKRPRKGKVHVGTDGLLFTVRRFSDV